MCLANVSHRIDLMWGCSLAYTDTIFLF
jgi:hypothetical protein